MCVFFISCGLQKNLNYSSENINPVQDFEIDSLYFEIDYSKKVIGLLGLIQMILRN